MKSLLLFFTLLVPSYLLFAQKPERVKNAFYYDSLIKAGDSCNAFNYSFLASIYIKENNLRELKTTYERAMKCPLKNFIQLGFYLQLADIYLREGRMA
jgi:hypothetical protein